MGRRTAAIWRGRGTATSFFFLEKEGKLVAESRRYGLLDILRRMRER